MRKFFLYKPTCILYFEFIFCRADMDTILVSIFLMAFLNFYKKFISFKCDGIVFYILVPRYLRLSNLWFTIFTFGIINCNLFVKLY